MIVLVDDVDVVALPVGALFPRRAPLSIATLRVRLRSWEQLDRDYELRPLDDEARAALRDWIRATDAQETLWRDHVFVDARGVVLVLDEALWSASSRG